MRFLRHQNFKCIQNFMGTLYNLLIDVDKKKADLVTPDLNMALESETLIKLAEAINNLNSSRFP